MSPLCPPSLEATQSSARNVWQNTHQVARTRVAARFRCMRIAKAYRCTRDGDPQRHTCDGSTMGVGESDHSTGNVIIVEEDMIVVDVD